MAPCIVKPRWENGNFCAIVHEGQEFEAQILGQDKEAGSAIIVLIENGGIIEVDIRRLVASRGHEVRALARARLSASQARRDAARRDAAAATAAAATPAEDEAPPTTSHEVPSTRQDAGSRPR